MIGPGAPQVGEGSLHARVTRTGAPCASTFGDKVALIDQGRSFTFRQLDELSGALAASLVGLGVVPGDRVALYAPNSWE